jgi:RNA polymerase sigma-70 factor (ECF subfamily)
MTDINLYLKNFKKSGDKIWFEKIYHCFITKIYNYYYYKIFDRQIAEDLTSEVLIKVYKNLRKNEFNVKSFTSWIYKIANNQLIDYYRKTKNEKYILSLPDDMESIESENLVETDYFIKNSSLIKKELGFENVKIISAMNKLTKLQKDVVTLIFLEDCDYKTIAEIYGKKQSTVRGILFRAMNILKNEMKN